MCVCVCVYVCVYVHVWAWERTSSALLGRGGSSPLFAVFCLRLLLLAARAGLSAPVSLTSLDAGRLAVGVLPRDARDVEAMPSALVGGAGEARGGVLLSMAGDLVPALAPALRERTSCLHEPRRQSLRHVHLHLTLGRWWQSQTTHALRTHSQEQP